MSFEPGGAHSAQNRGMVTQQSDQNREPASLSYRYESRSNAGSFVTPVDNNEDKGQSRQSSGWHCLKNMCGCQIDYGFERLEYDYNIDETLTNNTQPMPRIRERGEYYIDSFNGEPWSCTFGTNEEVSISCLFCLL